MFKKFRNGTIGITVFAILVMFVMIFLGPHAGLTVNGINMAKAFGVIFFINNAFWWWRIATTDKQSSKPDINPIGPRLN